MKQVIMLALTFFFVSSVYAQEVTNKDVKGDENILAPETGQPDTGVLMFAELMPQFPGGDSKMYEFIFSHIVYPDSAKENGIQGRVIVTFVVLEDGSLTDINVKKPVHPLLDKAALDVITSMPKWKPGKQNGKAVKVRFVVPISFKLE